MPYTPYKFPHSIEKRDIGGIGIQHLALQPGNASFTHGNIVPVRLDSLIQRGRQRSKRGRAGSQSHTLPYHDGKKTKMNNLLSMTIKFMQI